MEYETFRRWKGKCLDLPAGTYCAGVKATFSTFTVAGWEVECAATAIPIGTFAGSLSRFCVATSVHACPSAEKAPVIASPLRVSRSQSGKFPAGLGGLALVGAVLGLARTIWLTPPLGTLRRLETRRAHFEGGLIFEQFGCERLELRDPGVAPAGRRVAEVPQQFAGVLRVVQRPVLGAIGQESDRFKIGSVQPRRRRLQDRLGGGHRARQGM
jgi:hypothetical protein